MMVTITVYSPPHIWYNTTESNNLKFKAFTVIWKQGELSLQCASKGWPQYIKWIVLVAVISLAGKCWCETNYQMTQNVVCYHAQHSNGIDWKCEVPEFSSCATLFCCWTLSGYGGYFNKTKIRTHCIFTQLKWCVVIMQFALQLRIDQNL